MKPWLMLHHQLVSRYRLKDGYCTHTAATDPSLLDQVVTQSQLTVPRLLGRLHHYMLSDGHALGIAPT